MTGDRAERTQGFYTRWAGIYDAIASYTPGIRRLRQHAVDSLGLEAGDTVVEFGCGTGANVPFLRDAVGQTGTVVGVDFTPGMVARASRLAARWENVHVVRGDATRPPIRGADAAGDGDDAANHGDDTAGVVGTGPTAPDAVFASFLSGMLDDPAGAVESWGSLVRPGGRVGLLDLARSTGTGRPLNPLFALVVRVSAPPGGVRSATALATMLDKRVAAAHRAVLEGCRDPVHETAMLGFVRLSSGEF